MSVGNVAHWLFVTRARIVGFYWGVAEATVFFVLPDFFLAPAIIANPKQAWRLVLAITAGSAVGALIVSLFVAVAPATMCTFITALPFTNEAMIAKASLHAGESLASFWQPFSGVPMKAWIWSMITGGTAFIAFFSVMMVGRMMRFVLVALIALLVERFFGDMMRRHAAVFFVAYVIIFFASLARIANVI